ncbi:DUF2637 domain-containing protein [Streptomyces sp. NPDC088732]|uniref:DUF2637 domain-containing protein n=1 Tax=Streptomyces sp. NPDC088732 TaxID=3365879 RepID=UPI0038028C76
MTERQTLTPMQRRFVYAVAAGALIIAAVGFAGSYTAVTDVAENEGFGWFARVLPAGIDAGIGVLLALDLLLTWLRMPYPLLRYTAWLLTIATIVFNAAAAWPRPIGVGMHAVIPILFVIVTEAARHAIGRAADIVADRSMDSIRLARWFLAPAATFVLWRRMKLWEVRSYDELIRIEQDRLVYRARLRARYGRAWRRKAPVEMLLPLRLARYGVALADATAAIDGATPVATPAATATPARPRRRSAPVIDTATAPATPELPAAAIATAVDEPPATARERVLTGLGMDATVPPPVEPDPAPEPEAAPIVTDYQPGTPQYVVHTLWLTLGHQPGGRDISTALGKEGLPNSEQQARKIRAQVRREVADLPGPRAA